MSQPNQQDKEVSGVIFPTVSRRSSDGNRYVELQGCTISLIDQYGYGASLNIDPETRKTLRTVLAKLDVAFPVWLCLCSQLGDTLYAKLLSILLTLAKPEADNLIPGVSTTDIKKILAIIDSSTPQP